MQAPSAHNEQPWLFIVVDEKDILEKVSDLGLYVKMAKKAPLGILVCGDLQLQRAPGFWVQDCSAAVQNMLLAVTDMKLGAVWSGIYPQEDLVKNYKSVFCLPENIIPFAFVVIGYPDEKLPRNDRYKEEKVRYNNWLRG